MHVIRQPLYFLASLLVLFSCTKTEEMPRVEITRLQPGKARVNQAIQVFGKGFGNLLASDSSANFRLYIGGIQCDASVMSDSLIEVFIPANARTGEVCVEWKGEKACGPAPFTLLPGNGVQNTFQRMPDYPGKKNRPSSMFALQGNIYIGFDDFWKFSVDDHTWTRVADLPEWASRTATFVIGERAYVFGGLTASAGNGSNALYAYDPTANKWEKKAAMPAVGRMDCQVFVHDHRAYIFGGRTVSNDAIARECWRYDPATDTWQRLADLPETPEVEGRPYRIGTHFYVPTTTVLQTLVFNPADGNWQVLRSGPQTRFSAIHASSRWEMAYMIQANQVYRMVRRFDGEVMVQSYQFPIAPGDKPFMLHASAGEELFFLHINELTYANEFWEYLPE